MVDVKNGLLVHECRKGEVWIKERLGTCGDCSGDVGLVGIGLMMGLARAEEGGGGHWIDASQSKNIQDMIHVFKLNS